MTDEEAAAIVDEELQRRDREETVREARKILRANYGQRLKEAAAAVTTADQAVEVAKAAVDRQEDLRLASRRGAGPTNESIVALRVAQQRLREAERAYERVRDAEPDQPVPAPAGQGLTCVADATPFDHEGRCLVCRRPAAAVGRGPVLTREARDTLAPSLTRGTFSR